MRKTIKQPNKIETALQKNTYQKKKIEIKQLILRVFKFIKFSNKEKFIM